MQYPNALHVLDQDLALAPDGNITNLARRLIEGGKKLDMHKAKNLGVERRYAHIVRDPENPPSYTHESVLGAPWADSEETPLEEGERWNEGRRATNTGLRYTFNQCGRPMNPYMNTGMDGRGVLGRFGPNHAVDSGIILIHDGDRGPELRTQCIIRRNSGQIAFAGGFAKYQRKPDGSYTFDTEAVMQTRMEEMFEEMISGSIPLLPEYAARVEPEFEAEIARWMHGRGGTDISNEQRHEIREQIETAMKMQQVEDLDPGFLRRLHEIVAKGHECYAGPILKSNRNTNNAWIETRLSWILLDVNTWTYICGKNPVFDYRFKEGDDAAGIKIVKIDPWLVQNANGSHGPMMAYMAASYLLHAQRNGDAIAPSIVTQLHAVAEFLETGPPVFDLQLSPPS
jgi:hypothetical protein